MIEQLLDDARDARKAGHLARAEALYREAVRVEPGFPQAHRDLGVVLIEAGRYDAAVVALRAALATDAGSSTAASLLATALLGARHFEEAIEAARAAIALDPNDPRPHATLGAAAVESDRFADALAAYDRARRLKPADPYIYVSIAHVLHLLGEFDAEVAALEAALVLEPDFADAHSNLGMVLLLRGELTRGWSEYTRYMESPANVKSAAFPYLGIVPTWNGRPFEGRLVVARDQGFGDFVQMMRYFPVVKARGGTVVVEVPRALERLASRCAGIDEVRVVRNVERPLRDVAWHIPLMSLPRVLGRIESSTPYIDADPVLVERWAARLPPHAGKRVGIIWAGNSVHVDDRHRSCRLEDVAPLGAVEGIAWIGLQKGRDETRASCGALELMPLGAQIGDFADTAAIVAQLDLVITVDTAVAHVAGALGKPVWTLLPFVPDWRWMLEREDTPWYPTMRLFRQDRSRSWEPVIACVAAALTEFAS